MLLNQIQDGTSFGVKEMSAKNSYVPTKSRTRAKTSFQALFLSVRATAADSNLKAASFNVLSALSSLRATPETDNCGSDLWLASFARASSLLRSACFCFAYP